MSAKYLLLWLEGPLQSWGFDSRFDRRDTLAFPTRSGILGILCAAMGAKGEQEEFLKEMARYSQTAISYLSAENNGQRHKNPAISRRLTDYHTVGNGYDDKDSWEKLNIPKTSDGKKAVGGGSKITHRTYLQDSVFAVIAEIPKHLAQGVKEALTYPAYHICLGRKCCMPTEFVFQGIFDSEEEAFKKATAIASDKNMIEEFKIVPADEDDIASGDAVTLCDVPLRFGEHKLYSERTVKKIDG